MGDPTKRNQKYRCSYHQDKGHLMENYKAFKQHLVDLAKAEHMKEYVDEKRTRREAMRELSKRIAKRDHLQRMEMDPGGH